MSSIRTPSQVKAAAAHFVPQRIRRLDLPERMNVLGMSLREAERKLEANCANQQLVDLTCADTRRFPPPDWAIEALASAAAAGGLTYTPYRGGKPVRTRVAENVSAFLGTPVDPDRELIITPGTQGGLFAALSATIEAGDTVVLTDPDYLTNERMLRFLGAAVEPVPVLWERRTRAMPDMEKLERALSRGARAMLFSNPNNPTGAVYDPEIVRSIAQLALKHDVLVIVDELYSRLVYDGRPFLHLASVEGMRERTITLLGPSKTESMSGFRLGVAVAPARIVDRMEDVQSVAALRAPAYAQYALMRWLGDDKDFVRRRVNDYQRLRDYTVDRLERTGVIEVVPSGGTSYLFPHLRGIHASDQEVALRLQDEAGVIVNPGYQSGLRGMGHFRLCFAQDEETYEGVLDRIAATLLAMRS